MNDPPLVRVSVAVASIAIMADTSEMGAIEADSDDESGLPPISVQLSHFGRDPAFDAVFQGVVINQNVLSYLAAEIMRLVPDTASWRLTVSGDLAASVNDMKTKRTGAPYTVERGSGRAGAITMPYGDGTFDVIVSADVLLAISEEDVEDPPRMIARVIAAARHLGRHEAGHILLAQRGEDGDKYRDLPTWVSATEMGWTHVLAAHIDDNRIEQHTRVDVPSPYLQVDGLGAAIQHLRDELNAARGSWADDIDAAMRRTGAAINSMLRVIAYLSAELGLRADGSPARPLSLPEGWDEYLESYWDRWSSAYHQLRPVDEPMSQLEIARVLGDLCELAVEWCNAIGYVTGVDPLGRPYSSWIRNEY